MRKALFTTAILSILSVGAFAQKWYIKAGVGYTMPMAAQTLDITNNAYSGNAVYNPQTDSIASYSIKKASFSTGVKGIVGLGYAINNHVSFEAAVNMGLSNTKYTSTQHNVKAPGGAYLADNTITENAQFPVMLMPSAVFKTDKPKLNWYGRLGLVMPLKSEILIDLVSEYQSFIPNTEEIKGTLKTRFNVGFTGAGGVNYLAGKGVHVWAEFNFMSISLFAKETKITQHTGATNPNSAPLTGTTVSYGFSGQAGALQQPTFSIPYSNMGISIGANFDIK